MGNILGINSAIVEAGERTRRAMVEEANMFVETQRLDADLHRSRTETRAAQWTTTMDAVSAMAKACETMYKRYLETSAEKAKCVAELYGSLSQTELELVKMLSVLYVTNYANPMEKMKTINMVQGLLDIMARQKAELLERLKSLVTFEDAYAVEQLLQKVQYGIEKLVAEARIVK